jgi:REP element-mobilizing transposase RayT
VKYDPDVHHRRSIRLAGYDYSMAGYYFVTICTNEREIVLGRAEVADAVADVWAGLPRRFPGVELDEFVVMPNHIHGIVILRDSGAKLGKVMRAFKSISAIAANRILVRAERPFWQRDYYERVIRSETELLAVRQYIRDNPLAWDVDPENPDALASSRRL